MLTKLGPFLLVPFLVSDWTDNQWPALCLREASSLTAPAKDEAYSPAGAQARDQILKKIQAKPALCFLLPVETICCSLAPVSIQDPDDSRFLIAADPLYQFMSLQI